MDLNALASYQISALMESLHSACKTGNLEIIQLFFTNLDGIDLRMNFKSNYKENTPLHILCKHISEHKNLEALEWMLENSQNYHIDINAQIKVYPSYRTPFQEMCFADENSKNTIIVKAIDLFLKYPINIFDDYEDDDVPLYIGRRPPSFRTSIAKLKLETLKEIIQKRYDELKNRGQSTSSIEKHLGKPIFGGDMFNGYDKQRYHFTLKQLVYEILKEKQKENFIIIFQSKIDNVHPKISPKLKDTLQTLGMKYWVCNKCQRIFPEEKETRLHFITEHKNIPEAKDYHSEDSKNITERDQHDGDHDATWIGIEDRIRRLDRIPYLNRPNHTCTHAQR